MKLMATAVAVYLSLNIEVVDEERGAGLLAVPLVSLTRLAGWVWGLGRVQAAVGLRLARVRLAWTLAGIGWRSLVWGLAGG